METRIKPTTVLVAGANGFIGRHVVQALEAAMPANRVVQIDRRLGRVCDPRVGCELDIGAVDTEALVRIMEDFEVAAVVNCAGTTRSQSDVLQAENIDITAKLVDAAAQVTPGIRFCQIGSAAEYQMLPRAHKTREDAPTNPAGDYGRSKLESSARVLAAARLRRVSGYVLRLFNPVGIGMPSTQLIGRVLEYLDSRTPTELLLGSLESYRDFIDVRDVGDAVAAAVESPEDLRGEVINIGSGTAHQTRDLVTRIFAAAGHGSFCEEAVTGSERSKWAVWQEADISKAERLLRWKPRFSLQQTVLHLVTPGNTVQVERAENRSLS